MIIRGVKWIDVVCHQKKRHYYIIPFGKMSTIDFVDKYAKLPAESIIKDDEISLEGIRPFF